MAALAKVARIVTPLALALGLLGAAPAGEERRVALVIGEGAYQSAPALANPPNDARDVAQMLRSLGFEVTLRVDVGQSAMTQAINEFGERAEHSDLALFYYGGHGLQLDQRNYLVPVDAALHGAGDIGRRTVPLDKVKVALAKSPQSLIFLDACRENPLKGADSSAPAGLARVGAAATSLIAYATQPDNVAFDGAGRNSPYAQALLNNLTVSGVDFNNMMIAVHRDVKAATGDAQAPMEETSLTRQIFLAGRGPADASPEAEMWRVAKHERAPELLQLYLKNYPNGEHAADVKALLAAHGGAEAGPAADNRDSEEKVWRLALKSSDAAPAEYYLRQYANGAHAREAEERIRQLKEQQSSAKEPGTRCDQLATHPHDATASTPGVDLATLARNATQAIEACEQARAASPKVPHYQALLARAHYAAGHYDEAVKFYRAAADAGDARALWSLGRLVENGDHTPKDVAAAYALYQKAADRGSADGAIDVAVALMEGKVLTKDVKRAYALLQTAAQSGSGIAAFDLGKIADDGLAGSAADALGLYRFAAEHGYSEGHRAAAVLLDEGRHTAKNPEAAAEDLLKAVAADSGRAAAELTATAQAWAPATVSAVQRRLKDAGYYSGAIDGRSGPGLAPALKRWRLLGDPRGIVARATK